MDYASIVFVWLLFATLSAGVTEITAILFGRRFTHGLSMAHLINWVGLPIWVASFIVISFLIILKAKTVDIKVELLKKLWFLLLKSLCADYPN